MSAGLVLEFGFQCGFVGNSPGVSGLALFRRNERWSLCCGAVLSEIVLEFGFQCASAGNSAGVTEPVYFQRNEHWSLSSSAVLSKLALGFPYQHCCGGISTGIRGLALEGKIAHLFKNLACYASPPEVEASYGISTDPRHLMYRDHADGRIAKRGSEGREGRS